MVFFCFIIVFKNDKKHKNILVLSVNKECLIIVINTYITYITHKIYKNVTYLLLEKKHFLIRKLIKNVGKYKKEKNRLDTRYATIFTF